MISNAQIGNRISALLKEKKLKQVDITDPAILKSSHFNHIVNGKTGASLETLQLICDRLGVSLEEFFHPFSGKVQLPSYLSQFFSTCEELNPADVEVLEPIIHYLIGLRKDSDPIPSTIISSSLPTLPRKKTPSKRRISATLPISGEAAAGLPLFSSIDDEAVSVPNRYADPDRFLAVRARGDSMEPRIHSGDTVIAQRGLVPQAGQPALVCLAGLSDDEYTIKRFYPEHDRLVLRSYNDAYQDMIYSPDDLRTCDAVVHVIPAADA